jgi:hypothetical protein
LPASPVEILKRGEKKENTNMYKPRGRQSKIHSRLNGINFSNSINKPPFHTDAKTLKIKIQGYLSLMLLLKYFSFSRLTHKHHEVHI